MNEQSSSLCYSYGSSPDIDEAWNNAISAINPASRVVFVQWQNYVQADDLIFSVWITYSIATQVPNSVRAIDALPVYMRDPRS